MNFRATAASAAVLLSLTSPTVASAQDAAAPASVEGVTVYDLDFFARYNPQNALDMVQQLPGFSVDGGDNRRGFAATAGNVLVDGERPSTKSNIFSYLERIAATNVERVELIRGSSSAVDMRGQSIVANVILKESAGGVSTNWRVSVDHFQQSDQLEPSGEATTSFKLGKADIRLSLERDSWAGEGKARRVRRDADGDLLFFQDEMYPGHFRALQPNVEIELKAGEKDTFHLNAGGEKWKYHERGVIRSFNSDSRPPTPAEIRFPNFDEDGWNYNAGGDWEHTFTDRFSTKLILYTEETNFDWESRQDVFNRGFVEADRVTLDGSRGESIVRGQANFALSDKHAFEFGLEGAFNFLENQLDVASDDGSGGGFVEIELPVSDTRVEEKRAEASLSYVWKPRPTVSLESVFAYEASEIAQSGEGANERRLYFAKPKFVGTWTPNDKNQFRFTVERDVSQLDFGDFATSTSITEDTTDVGNPDLEPERLWGVEGVYERKFWERGAITLTARRDFVESVEDQVPINNEFDAPGNLGDGDRWYVSMESTLPLEFLGLSGAQLDSEIRYGDSSVTDPVTGQERPFSFEERKWWYLEFRQDLPERGLTWGWDYFKGFGNRGFRLTEESQFIPGHGDFDAYVEFIRPSGMKIRFAVDNIFNTPFKRTRTFYDPTRAGMVVMREERVSRDGPRPSIRVSGTF